MSAAEDDADDDAPDLPEPEPARPVTPGSASWAERLGDGVPPYEESEQQIKAKWKAGLAGLPDKVREERLEARRKRKARVAQRANAVEQERERKRLGERWRTT